MSYGRYSTGILQPNPRYMPTVPPTRFIVGKEVADECRNRLKKYAEARKELWQGRYDVASGLFQELIGKTPEIPTECLIRLPSEFYEDARPSWEPPKLYFPYYYRAEALIIRADLHLKKARKEKNPSLSVDEKREAEAKLELAMECLARSVASSVPGATHLLARAKKLLKKAGRSIGATRCARTEPCERPRHSWSRHAGHLFTRHMFQKPIWPLFFLKEMFSSFDSRSFRLLLSDGGHFENLGLYELVRRRCRYIIVSDATADPEHGLRSLGNAIRRCRVDHGCEITLDLSQLQPNPATGHSDRHVVVGDISYADGTSGILVYMKSTLTGDEPADLIEYRRSNPSFPHESTARQFFDEAQFESYRRLGEHIARGAFEEVKATGSTDTFFRAVRNRWRAPAADGGEDFVELCRDLMTLESSAVIQGPNILDAQQYPELLGPLSKPPTPKEEVELLHHVFKQLQWMENFWMALRLDDPRNREHPDNRGAMNLFRRWARSPYFRQSYSVLRSNYGQEFQKFCETQLGLPTNEECLDVREAEINDARLTVCRAMYQYDPLLTPLESLFDRVDRKSARLYLAELNHHGHGSPTPVGYTFLINAQVGKGGKEATAGELFSFAVDNRFYFCEIPEELLECVTRDSKNEGRSLVVMPIFGTSGESDRLQWEAARRYFQKLGFISRTLSRPDPSANGDQDRLESYVWNLLKLPPRPADLDVTRLKELPFVYLPPFKH